MFNKKRDELLDDSDLHAEAPVEVEETPIQASTDIAAQ